MCRFMTLCEVESTGEIDVVVGVLNRQLNLGLCICGTASRIRSDDSPTRGRSVLTHTYVVHHIATYIVCGRLQMRLRIFYEFA
jgi:hypothetical protein